MKSIYDYTQEQMIEEFKELGEKKFTSTSCRPSSKYSRPRARKPCMWRQGGVS